VSFVKGDVVTKSAFAVEEMETLVN